MEQNLEEYRDWCYANHVYFYAFTAGCEKGFCKIAKWVRGVPQQGKKLFKIANVENEIMQLYKQVYQINHK